jgi:Leucine-rich repeat (LRR) protein
MFRSLYALTLILAANVASAEIVPVCTRTPAVKAALEALTSKTCDKIVDADLLTINRVAVNNRNIAEFKVDDFNGLTNLEILNIRSNPFTALPEGLFKPLPHLKTLVIISGQLRNYPDDYLADTPELENIHVFRNPVRSISESVFKRLEAMKNLKVLDVGAELQPAELARLKQMFPENGPVQLIIN